MYLTKQKKDTFFFKIKTKNEENPFNHPLGASYIKSLILVSENSALKKHHAKKSK